MHLFLKCLQFPAMKIPIRCEIVLLSAASRDSAGAGGRAFLGGGGNHSNRSFGPSRRVRVLPRSACQRPRQPTAPPPLPPGQKKSAAQMNRVCCAKTARNANKWVRHRWPATTTSRLFHVALPPPTPPPPRASFVAPFCPRGFPCPHPGEPWPDPAP